MFVFIKLKYSMCAQIMSANNSDTDNALMFSKRSNSTQEYYTCTKTCDALLIATSNLVIGGVIYLFLFNTNRPANQKFGHCVCSRTYLTSR